MPLTAAFSRSLCTGIGRDRVSEQRSSCPWPSSHPALLLHHQCCPQQSQHHLDGNTTVQCQPTRAGNEKMQLRKKLLGSELTFCAKSVFSFSCSLRDNSIRWHIPVPHNSVSGWFCLQKFLILFQQCWVAVCFAFVLHPNIPSWFETYLYSYLCLGRAKAQPLPSVAQLFLLWLCDPIWVG